MWLWMGVWSNLPFCVVALYRIFRGRRCTWFVQNQLEEKTEPLPPHSIGFLYDVIATPTTRPPSGFHICTTDPITYWALHFLHCFMFPTAWFGFSSYLWDGCVTLWDHLAPSEIRLIHLLHITRFCKQSIMSVLLTSCFSKDKFIVVYL